MCNRYGNRRNELAVTRLFGRFADPAHRTLSFDQVRPTNAAMVVRRDPADGARRADLLRWDLIPAWWHKPLKEKPLLTNARAEGVAEKPSFRTAFARRRCLVPADIWFEWRAGNDPKGRKQPYGFTVDGGEPFAFAGLWENWKAPDDQWVRSFTIITTEARADIAGIHNRMPVVLAPDIHDAWLHPDTDPATLLPWLKPWPGALTAEPVTLAVN
jgi:putative SOS response-associated peptidase YedK